ncbi:MAG: hypothetical protein IPL61_28535 [Myxococcales bacterium]|nr:hypothetical protein [Myxococcales bacterium]
MNRTPPHPLARTPARPLARTLAHPLARTLAHPLARTLAHPLARTLARLVVVVVALALGTGVAQARPDRPRRGPMVADKTADRAAKRERVKQRIRMMRALVLTEQLGLDEATAGKMIPVLGKYDDELARLLGERATLRAKLDGARTSGKAADISTLLDGLVANQRARWTAEERRFAELRALLTPAQAATLLDLLPEVDRKILRALRGAVAPDPEGDGRRRPRRRQGDTLENPFDTRK